MNKLWILLLCTVLSLAMQPQKNQYKSATTSALAQLLNRDGFSEMKSVQKTLRKPVDQLKEFKAAGKVALRKFLEDINAVDTKMNGRINEEIMLLKVA